MMAITTYDYVTIISLLLACFASVVTVILYRESRRQKQISRVEPDSVIEITAIVDEFTQRLKRIEQGLIDQRVKQEILELRMKREVIRAPSEQVVTAGGEFAVRPVAVEVKPVVRRERVYAQPVEASKKPATTEVEILGLVKDSQGRITARDIQKQIGKTREHTARMMNALYQEGLVERDVSVRPFAYSLTQKGVELLQKVGT